jgi:hypothetical protein
VAQSSPLKPIYRSDDGGILYVRAVGDNVYGFGEHPGKKYAYVLSGTRNGDFINAKFWDIPKGTLTEYGSIQLQISQGGTRLVRKTAAKIGIDTWQEISPNGIPWPEMQSAGFQKTSSTDLDGVFVDETATRHYVRELNGDVVWVAEPGEQPGVRPAWVSVFVGKRTNTGISGTFADVPKGLAATKGSFGAALIGNQRRLNLQQVGAARGHLLDPEYAIDWDRFASLIRTALEGKTIGYSYAIGRNGALIRSGAGGYRRLAQDGGREKFTVNTQSQAASTSKTLTAVALVKALKDRGSSVDANVAPFLPNCLEQGPGINTLKFRELLDHTSGLSEPGGCKDDPYGCLQEMVKKGRTSKGTYNYNNSAYGFMRLLVPLIAYPQQAKGQFTLFKCTDTKGQLNSDISEMFVRYLFDNVLKPANAQASYYPSGDFALVYDFSNPTEKGGAPRPDFTQHAGAGYLAISAPNYLKFLGALDRGDLVSKSLVQSMYSGNLGFDGPYNGVAGKYYTKNGGCPTGACGAQSMIYPGGVQAYVMVNSGAPSPGLKAILASAYEQSLR